MFWKDSRIKKKQVLRKERLLSREKPKEGGVRKTFSANGGGGQDLGGEKGEWKKEIDSASRKEEKGKVVGMWPRIAKLLSPRWGA